MSWELKLEHKGELESIATGVFSDDGVTLYDGYAEKGSRVSLFFTGLLGRTTLEKSTIVPSGGHAHE